MKSNSPDPRRGHIYGLHTGGPIRYIGKTLATPTKRLVSHRHSARKGSRAAVHCWMRSHDYDVQVVSLVHGVPATELDDCERFWIALLRPSGFLLNHTDGGDGGPTRFGPMSAESMARLRESIKTRVLPDDFGERARAGRVAKSGGPVCCIMCEREFPTTLSLATHRGAVHSGGNIKRAESLRKAWAEDAGRFRHNAAATHCATCGLERKVYPNGTRDCLPCAAAREQRKRDAYYSQGLTAWGREPLGLKRPNCIVCGRFADYGSSHCRNHLAREGSPDVLPPPLSSRQ